MTLPYSSILVCVLSVWLKLSAASPSILSPVVTNGTCSSLDAAREALTANIQALLFNDSLTAASKHCSCGENTGQWTQVAHLNMSNPEEQCPANWSLFTHRRFRRLRGCDMSSRERYKCDSLHLSTGQPYSHVCGRVIGFQRGSTDAFYTSINSNRGLEDAYIDGMSLTHGAEGSRQHIWSFAAAQSEEAYGSRKYICPCTDSNRDWPNLIPSFVGKSYFCDTGASYCTPSKRTVIVDDPLWDGEGCGPYSSCCSFNSPPWFCKELPHTTTNAIELRLCSSSPAYESTIVNLVDIYVT